LVIDGSQALTVAFDVGGFGTAGANGVSSINGAAATGALSINLANVSAATSGLTVTGGSGADTITTSNFAATLTGGAGTDKFVLSASANTTALVDAVITDFTKGESITFVNKGTETFTSTKLDVSAAQTLEAAVTLASADNGSTNATVKWFQYGSDTYVVEHNAAAGLSSATDVVVKLTGLLDLSTASLGGTDGNVLTY
jgi:S-layer protein